MNENEVEKTYDETQDELVQNESLDDEKQSVHQSEEVSDVAIDDDAVKDDLENQQESESLSKNVEQNEEIEDCPKWKKRTKITAKKPKWNGDKWYAC